MSFLSGHKSGHLNFHFLEPIEDAGVYTNAKRMYSYDTVKNQIILTPNNFHCKRPKIGTKQFHHGVILSDDIDRTLRKHAHVINCNFSWLQIIFR